MEQTEKKGKGKKVIGAVAGIIAFGISYVVVQQLFFKKSYDKALHEAAAEVNKSCPVVLDQETRLDSAVVLPENIFQYNYTLIHKSKDLLNSDTVKKYLEPGIVSAVKTSPALKKFRDNKTTLAYHYSDSTGASLAEIRVTPEMYKE